MNRGRDEDSAGRRRTCSRCKTGSGKSSITTRTASRDFVDLRKNERERERDRERERERENERERTRERGRERERDGDWGGNVPFNDAWKGALLFMMNVNNQLKLNERRPPPRPTPPRRSARENHYPPSLIGPKLYPLLWKKSVPPGVHPRSSFLKVLSFGSTETQLGRPK